MSRDVLDGPSFCQYDADVCQRIKGRLELQDAFCAYPSKPENISSQVSEACAAIAQQNVCDIQDWKNLSVGGKIIFCEICKGIRRSKILLADLTTLNENVLFEVGYAIGLGKHIWPVRDVSYEKDLKDLKKIGLFDYTGYNDFRNSNDILTKFLLERPWLSTDGDNPFRCEPSLGSTSRLFYLKAQYTNDGSVTLTSLVKKSRIPSTTVDPSENLQLSLRDYSKMIAESLGVLVHMVDPARRDSRVHNAICAFIAGMAVALEKPALILQEGDHVDKPIDFGEIVRHYSNSKNIPLLFQPWISSVKKNQERAEAATPAPRQSSVLERINLGQLAAENEIEELDNYFVPTPIFNDLIGIKEAIVAGRKGSGKTALFYQVRGKFWRRRDHFVLGL